MDLSITRDAISGVDLKPQQIQSFDGLTIEYETPITGKVKITHPAYMMLLNGSYERYLIGGITKNMTVKNIEPILIDDAFINGGYKQYNPPTQFEEKCITYLKYLYNTGGKESRKFDYINPYLECYAAYADHEEFARIIHWLSEENYFINIKNITATRGGKYYHGVTMTSAGKEEAKSLLPQLPMVALYSQEISTGDAKIDERINHARDLFLQEPQTMDNMRSACEALGTVLEPLRDDLGRLISVKDTQDLFQLINQFDVRHNKERTKSITDPELLEWVFNSLLNTINAYNKLKQKLIP